MRQKNAEPVISAIALSIFIFGYAALLLLNRTFLSNPPYGNDITALHRQAIWLAGHHFDIIALWAPDQTFPEGGANAYPFGLVPYFYGVLYSTLPSTTVHLVGHCLNNAFIVAAFAISFFLIARLTGRLLPAFFWSLAALADPIIQSRSAGLGHESLLLLLIMVWLLAIYKRQCRLALALLVLMCFVKMSALVIFVAFICWAAVMRKADNRTFGKTNVLAICGCLLTATLVLYGVTAAMDQLDFMIPARVLFNNIQMLHYIMPLTGSAIIIICVAGIIRYQHLIPAMFHQGQIQIAAKDRFLLLLVMITGAFWLAFVLYPEPCPRNAAMISFPMAVFGGVLLGRRQWGHVLALFFVVSGLTLSELDIPALPKNVHQRSSDLLERNITFVEDMYANLEACDFVEQYGGIVVSAPPPFPYMLSIPEMGYVRSALRHVSPAGETLSTTEINTVYIFTDNDFSDSRPPRPEDRILYWNRINNKAPIYIYNKKQQISR
ncbi:MAG: hypothetical protein VB042_00100 [Victivallaceae bacterium]|nr:hypothetical protein [Victivallaceae bacterium]